MFQIRPKSNIHCASYIAAELTTDPTDKLENGCQFIVKGEALFVNVFVPNRESCLQQKGKIIFICVKKL